MILNKVVKVVCCMKNKNMYIIINENNVKVKEGIKYENDDFCIVVNTPLYDNNHKKLKLNNVLMMYLQNIELANVVSNTFSVVIIDKKNQQVTCIQDLNGDSIPIYYFKHNKQLVFTNKIVNIINLYSNISFDMNEKSVKRFMKKGFIANQETLLSNIFKVLPKYNVTVYLDNKKKDKFCKKKIRYSKLKGINTEKYISEFKKILENYEKNKNVFTTLSNGYDSNFIFRFLNKNKTIEAFSIGGIAGRDEASLVEKNIQDYRGVHLNKAYVDEKTLENYPDLIYHLEGALYEQGIFLQYELSNTIHQKGNKNMILFSGEGSDQVFSWSYHSKFIDFLKQFRYFLSVVKHFFENDELSNLRIPGGFLNITSYYHSLTYVILKKNGILMNDINISYVHPYLMRPIIDIAYANRHLNLNDKKSHIKACEREIDPKIMKNIMNVGGTTEPIALFKNCSYLGRIENLVRNSKYNILKVSKERSFNEYLDYLLKVLYLEIFEYIFVKRSLTEENIKNTKLSDILDKLYLKKMYV